MGPRTVVHHHHIEAPQGGRDYQPPRPIWAALELRREGAFPAGSKARPRRAKDARQVAVKPVPGGCALGPFTARLWRLAWVLNRQPVSTKGRVWIFERIYAESPAGPPEATGRRTEQSPLAARVSPSDKRAKRSASGAENWLARLPVTAPGRAPGGLPLRLRSVRRTLCFESGLPWQAGGGGRA